MSLFFQCGFIRSCLLHVNMNSSFHSSDTHGKFLYFMEQFHHVDIEEKYFKRKLKDFTKFIDKAKWRGEKRGTYVNMFSYKVWKNLPASDKKKHSLYNCKQCILKFPEATSLFPKLNGTKNQINRHRNALTDITNTQQTPNKSNKSIDLGADTTNTQQTPNNSKECTELGEVTKTYITPQHDITPIAIHLTTTIPVGESTNSIMKESAMAVLTDVQNQWQKVYDTPFTKVLTKIPECNLKEKDSKSAQKKRLRTLHKNIKTAIETSWEENGKDTDTFFGTRQSMSRYSKQRSSLFFETKSKAQSSKFA